MSRMFRSLAQNERQRQAQERASAVTQTLDRPSRGSTILAAVLNRTASHPPRWLQRYLNG